MPLNVNDVYSYLLSLPVPGSYRDPDVQTTRRQIGQVVSRSKKAEAGEPWQSNVDPFLPEGLPKGASYSSTQNTSLLGGYQPNTDQITLYPSTIERQLTKEGQSMGHTLLHEGGHAAYYRSKGKESRNWQDLYDMMNEYLYSTGDYAEFLKQSGQSMGNDPNFWQKFYNPEWMGGVAEQLMRNLDGAKRKSKLRNDQETLDQQNQGNISGKKGNGRAMIDEIQQRLMTDYAAHGAGATDTWSGDPHSAGGPAKVQLPLSIMGLRSKPKVDTNDMLPIYNDPVDYFRDIALKDIYERRNRSK